MPWCRSLVVLILCAAGSLAADWPQWLGPNRDAGSTETVAPWKEAPKVLWRRPVGEGHSSPVVAAGRVFLHTKVKDRDEEELTAYDAKTGEPLWHAAYGRGMFTSLFGNGPRGTPAVVGGRVHAFGITGILSCFEAATGKQQWQVDTLRQFQATNLFFGMSGSPLVHDGKVFVNVGGKGASLVAFTADKGEVAWKALDDKASYSSPILFKADGREQLVFLTQQGLAALDPAEGTPLWKYSLVDRLSESSTTPVRNGDLLFASSITAGGFGLHLKSDGGKPAAEQAWKNEALNCYFSTPVFVGKDHLYVVTGTKPPAVRIESTLRCVDAKTGKELWQRPKIGKYHASLLRTGDNKLLLLDDAGNLMLLEPNSEKYTELARGKVCGETWAHPALADGRLYLRDGQELICLQLVQ